MSYRSWRLVHWSAYLCWPVAVLHGLGTGSDTPVRWVLALTVACVALVAALTAWRLAYGWPSHAAARLAGALALVLALIAGGAWLTAGPLAPGWALRAGTSPQLVSGGAKTGAQPVSAARARRAPGPRPGALPPPGLPRLIPPAGRCRSRTTSPGTARCRSRHAGRGGRGSGRPS